MRLTFAKEDTRQGYLMLVAPDYPILDGHGFKAMIPLGNFGPNGEKTAGGFGEIRMEQEAAGMLGRLLEHLKSDGQIVPVSGYRSHEEQVKIWEETMEKEGEVFTRTYVARPGHSEHESGLAIDLAENRKEIDFIRPEFPRNGICGQFQKQAAEYGFIERYREEKRAVTGIGTEPWHFRYVGWPHGAVMEEKGLALEEYLAFLREHTSVKKPCAFAEAGTEINIACVDLREDENAQAELPKKVYYQVSGTNEGGVILCWCRKLPWQWKAAGRYGVTV